MRYFPEGGKSRLADEPRIAVVRPLLFGALAVSALLWVAWFNGYPTVFSDTGSYLYTGKFLHALPPFRAPGYSMFTRVTSLGRSAWFIVVAQAFLVVYALRKTCAYLIGGDSRFRDTCLLVIVCLLAALTSLPWEASLLMPDVFAGLMFLAAFLLACDGELRLTERIGLAAVLAVSVSAHMSLMPIVALLIVALAMPRLAGWQPPGAPAIRVMLAWLLVPVIAAGLWTATLNRKMKLGFRLSASGNEFLLARLFGDGLAADFLRANCPKKPFIACRYLDELPRTQSEFLFYHPLLHDMAGHKNEINEISRGTIYAYPVRFAMSSIEETLRQLVSFRTGDEIRTTNAPDWNSVNIRQVFPRELPAFTNDRESRDRLSPLADALARMDTIVFWLSVAACVAFARTRRAARVNAFFYSAAAFLVINAALCASLVGVYDRYQSRVAWIVPLCLASYVACLVKPAESIPAIASANSSASSPEAVPIALPDPTFRDYPGSTQTDS